MLASHRANPLPPSLTGGSLALVSLALLLLACVVGPEDASARMAPEARADAVTDDPDADQPVVTDHAIVRGMTISCPGVGELWGSDDMVASMRTLRDLGVNWIAIHPYAGINADGTVSTGRRGRDMYDDPTWLVRPIREAHALGLKIMIKPHIAYWGSPFSWRGEIEFETDEQWDRFFTTYTAWITRVAELTRDADAFVVGTELDRTVRFDDRWRAIIRQIRATTPAPLTYAANWDSYERVRFWDDLDVIGVQGYFPLVNHTNVPAVEELEAGWADLARRLDAYADRYHRKVLFAELGYDRSVTAASRPWEGRNGGENAAEIQRRCMTIALAALERHDDTFVGAFLWKWFPGERQRGDFIMSTPAMQRIIGDAWRTRVSQRSDQPPAAPPVAPPAVDADAPAGSRNATVRRP